MRSGRVTPRRQARGTSDRRRYPSRWDEQRAASPGPLEPLAYGSTLLGAGERTPLKVNVFPRDVGQAVLFLASERSAKRTGTILNVDGGAAAGFPR